VIAALSNGVVPGLLLVFILASGVWLSRIGRPLSVAVLTIHKLIAVGAVILVARAIYLSSAGVSSAAPGALGVALAALFFVAMFASGAVLSGAGPVRAPLLLVHKLAALPALLLAAWATYILVV
jgi:hypothetical protein